jgi:uncharacterized protein YqeY
MNRGRLSPGMSDEAQSPAFRPPHAAGETSGPLCYSDRNERKIVALAEQIQKDLIEAMKARDELRAGVLRMVKTALKLKEVEKTRPLEDAESVQVFQTLVKQRRDSVEQYTKGGRQDLADKEAQEISIIETYLPAAASEEEMQAAIEAAIVKTGANSPKQMGAVIKAARAHLEGKTIDGKLLSDRVRQRLEKAGA